tara:strand:- start:299 stop:865 length:567 start_codon:yes stop_codon:yes gene_type:complete
MAVELANHVHEMYNSEKNSTARLRFIDKATQIALANEKYLLCRKYLASNPNLCEEARDILMEGKANSVKLNLLSQGHLNHAPDTISDLYFSMKRRGFGWWQRNTFVSGHYWAHSQHIPNTPIEVITDILEETMKDVPRYGASRTIGAIVSHPNATLEMAVRASTSDDETVKRAGFDRLIEFENAKKAA